MRIIAIITAAIALLLGTVTACSAATTAAPDEPTKVMIVGDSITQGAVGHHTWRYFFSQAVTDVDFVGNKQGTFSIYGGDWDYRGANAYAVSGWDSDHAAVWGGSMTNPAPEPKLYQLPIDELAGTYQPDVIVSAWGINDLNSGVTAAELIGFYNGWIAAARAEQPDVDFVISELPWTWGSLVAGRVAEFNGLLDGLASSESTDASRIVIARMSESYTKAADTYDGIHPNQQGEEKIARMIGAAYASLAPAPVVPETPVPVVVVPELTSVTPVVEPVVLEPVAARPLAPRGVKATQVGRRVVVRWRGVSGAEDYRVKCGTRTTTTGRTTASLRTSVTRCKVASVNDAGTSPWSTAKVKQQR